MHRTLLFIYYLVNFINHKAKMKSKIVKDRKMIGKLSSKKLDLSFCLSKQPKDRNASEILPSLNQSNERYAKTKSVHRKIQEMHSKFDVSSQCDDQREQPLPEIKVGYSKIQMLNRVCQRNPEEFYHLSKLTNSRKQKHSANQIHLKNSHLVGQLYSPKSRSMIYESEQQMKRPKKANFKASNFKNFLQNEYVKQLSKRQTIVNYKIIDYNRNLNDSINSSGYLKEKQKADIQQPLEQKQQFTQSRVIPIEPVTNIAAQKKIIGVRGDTALKNEGEKGFVAVSASDYKQDQSQLKFLWEQNYLDIKQGSTNKQSFYAQSGPKQELVQISFSTALSQLKVLLIEQQSTFKVSFAFSDQLRYGINDKITQPQMHILAQKLFRNIIPNFKPQLLSLKKYTNCILITAKVPKETKNVQKANKIAILWYFSGKFYIGGWRVQQSASQGYKCGLGMQYYPANYIYYGNFERNARWGYGIMKKSSKEVYLGQWTNNKRQGWGKVFGCEGELIFDGDFQDGRLTQNRTSIKNV